MWHKHHRIPPLLRSRKPVNATVIFVPKSERNSSPIIPTMLNIPNPSITPKGLWSTCYFARFRQCIGVGVLFEKLSRIKGLAVPDGTMKLEPDLVLALTATRKSLVSQESHPVHKAMGPVINAIDSAFRHILAWLECSHFAPPGMTTRQPLSTRSRIYLDTALPWTTWLRIRVST